MSDTKHYLGDGVYVDWDHYGYFTLTTENGFRITNTIVLEPTVYAALVQYADKVVATVTKKDEA